jgi:hypothetical protein
MTAGRRATLAAMGSDTPSVSQLVGQLGYVFDDEPELRDAPMQELLDRFNREDRFARARRAYPLATDDEIARKVVEFEDRIAVDRFVEALRQVRGADDEHGRTSHGS